MLTLSVLLLPLALSATPLSDSTAATTPPRPRFALVLSGGMARGLAHIGVLRALEEEGVRPDVIVGTSMGSLIGAMWAGGLPSAEIQRRFETSDVQALFEPHPRVTGWRGDGSPDPWLTLFGRGFLRFPPAMLDDAFLNDLLVRTLLNGDGLAQGDFDRLWVPWRAVATDIRTRTPVVLDRGSLARAVRSSVSVPVVLPGLVHDGALLVDGGIAADLPIATAQALGAEHVLGVDVALAPGALDERSSMLQLVMLMLQRQSPSGHFDARPGVDRVVWLKMPGFSPADFRLVDTLAAMGHHASRPVIAEIARAWRLPRAGASVARRATLPPLGAIEFLDADGRPARLARAAAHLFGEPPAGPLIPDTLGSRLARIHRGDLFRCCWPQFRIEGDATKLAFEVREHPPVEVAAAGGFERDRGGRIALNVVARPLAWAVPPVVIAGGRLSRYGRGVHGVLEPRSLARGASGWFLRSAARRSETRVFDARRVAAERVTERVEAVAGFQVALSPLGLLRGGAGGARVWSAGRRREGPLVAATLETSGRFARRVEAFALGGDDSYASVRVAASATFPTTRVALRPSVMAAWTTTDAPLDELPGIGGPRTLAGFRHDEWVGRRALAIELRFVRNVFTGVAVDAYLQAAHVADAVSRADLADRPHVAAGIGWRATMPFGPLELDLGLGEGGLRRFDLSIGQEF